MNAYDQRYLYEAATNLADATDYAVNYLGLPLSDFYEMFIVSGIAGQLGIGNPRYTVGMSGMDLADEVIETAGIKIQTAVREPYCGTLRKSREYWTGWILAYWQWQTGRSFAEMLKEIPVERVRRMYSPYHEADEQKFVDDAEEIIRENADARPTKLARMRAFAGLSQSELAAKAEVNIRSIQQYEQRSKDIRKGSVETVSKLARAIGCRVDDLI